MITEKLDQLIEYVTRNNSSDYIFQAKQEYQKIAGEIYEDDKSYENHMGLFLEWFIFDRLIPGKNITLIESTTNGNNQLALEDLTFFKDFSQSIHSLFVIKKIHQDDFVSFFLQSFAGLGSGVIEFASLANDNRACADD